MGERLTIAELAEAVADGRSVDWAAVEAGASDAERAAIDRLKRIEQIAGRVRSPGGGAESGATVQATASDTGEAHRWGHLTILEKVGEGAFGEVFRAHDPKLARDVALKLLRAPSSSATDVTSAIEEGRLLARIRHPNVVTVYGADRLDGRVGLWMEFVPGRTLEQELQDRGPFDMREAVQIGVDLTRALAAVHAAGLLHRDIKAQNVMRDADGRLVLMDFGTGREAAHATANAATDLAGTPLYVAPEVLQGQPATVRSDIYSLGVLLYHLVTGSYPRTADTLSNLIAAHRTKTRPSLETARPDLPAAFVAVVENAAASDPGQRYGSAAEMEAGLARVLPAMAPTSPRQWLAGVGVLAVVGAVGAILLIARPWSPAVVVPLPTPSVTALQLYALATTPSKATGSRPDLTVQAQYLRDAIRTDPEFASAELMLAVVLKAQGRPPAEYEPFLERARQLGERATLAEREVITGITHYWRAQKATGDAQRDEARLAASAFQAALLLDPTNSLALTSLHSVDAILGVTFDPSAVIAGSADGLPLSFDANVSAAMLRMGRGDVKGADRFYQLATHAEESGAGDVVWFRLFPGERDWAEGQPVRASEDIDLALEKAGDLSPFFRAQLMRDATDRLVTLGCLQRATVVAESIPVDYLNLRVGAIGMVLQRRGAQNELSDLMMPYVHDRLGWLLRQFWIPAGRLDQLPAAMRAGRPDPVIDVEVAFAEGRHAEAVRLGEEYLTQQFQGGKQPRLSVATTVGAALVAIGDSPRAIRLLEVHARTPAAVAIDNDQGYDWMRLRADLAALYRKARRIPDAKAIEQDLLKRLAAADPDFPLLVELRHRPVR